MMQTAFTSDWDADCRMRPSWLGGIPYLHSHVTSVATAAAHVADSADKTTHILEMKPRVPASRRLVGD
jgi:hypothetical protein